MSNKLAKQVILFCILLTICVIINFVLLYLRGGGGDVTLRKDLNEAYTKIAALEREVAYINENAGGEGGGKGIAYELLEGRVAILERNGVGSDASIDRRLSQLEMMVSTLEIAFKQATGVNPAASGNRQPATTTSTNTQTGRNNTQTPAVSSGGNKSPIQIQTGSSAAPSGNIKYHTVQAGENLFRISQKYGLTVEQLRKLNNMKESDVLKAGQKLIVSK